MRCLVIEDNDELRTQLTEQLRAQNYAVDAAPDGDEGLYLASEYPIDIAIIDLGLPGLSGLEVIKRVRAEPAPHLVGVHLPSRGEARPLWVFRRLAWWGQSLAIGLVAATLFRVCHRRLGGDEVAASFEREGGEPDA